MGYSEQLPRLSAALCAPNKKLCHVISHSFRRCALSRPLSRSPVPTRALRARTLGNTGGAQKQRTVHISPCLGVCFTDGIWRAGALPLRGQQEFLVKEVSRKLFSSEQASDDREAHRGRQSTPEQCAVQPVPAAPTAAGDGGLSTRTCHTPHVCKLRDRY
eukprot:scaffold58402_cov42-Phaeocystis_antarctica.AAC.1